MPLIVHLSDAHFGTEQGHVMSALTDLVHQQAPDLVVLSGDITQRARAKQFDAARRFVDGLGIPLEMALPGNHDIPLFNLFARCFRPYGHYVRVFGEVLAPIIVTPDMLVIGVNTTRWWRHKHGEVSSAQIGAVARRLHGASSRQLRLVVVHQPVHVPSAHDARDLLRGHAEAIQAWSAAGADAVLGGHIHLPYVRALHDELPGLPRRLWCIQAGTAVSSRVRGSAPNSINLLRWSASLAALEQGCLAEQWDFDAVKMIFRQVGSFEFHPDRSRPAERPARSTAQT